MAVISTTALLAALADPTRFSIVDHLRLGERCVGDLCVEVGGRQSLISFHLKVLRDAGLVSARKEGRTVWYSLDPSGLSRLAKLVERLRGSSDVTTRALRADVDTCRQYINGV